MSITNEERAEALHALRAKLPPDSTVYTVLRSASRSGMSRVLSTLIVEDGRLVDVTWYVARLLGYPLREVNGSRGLFVQGCGMDMGFHVVYGISRTLWNDTPEFTAWRSLHTEAHEDAGYALNHKWV